MPSKRWAVTIFIQDEGLATDEEVQQILEEQTYRRLVLKRPSVDDRFHCDEIEKIVVRRCENPEEV